MLQLAQNTDDPRRKARYAALAHSWLTLADAESEGGVARAALTAGTPQE